MARPPEPSLEYFSHSVATKDTLRRVMARHGYTAKWLWFELLERIYGKQGYYMPYSDEELQYVTDELRAPFETCRAALAMMLERDMLSAKLFEKHGILTSENIQRVWLHAKHKRTTLYIVPAYWLLDQTETTTTRIVKWIDIKAQNSVVRRRIMPENGALTPENEDIIPHTIQYNTTQYNTIGTGINHDFENGEKSDPLEAPPDPEHVALAAAPRDPADWQSFSDPTRRMLAHLESIRPDAETENGVRRAKSKPIERSWLVTWMQGHGEQKVHDAIEACAAKGYAGNREQMESALKGRLDELYPAKGGRRTEERATTTGVPKFNPSEIERRRATAVPLEGFGV